MPTARKKRVVKKKTGEPNKTVSPLKYSINGEEFATLDEVPEQISVTIKDAQSTEEEMNESLKESPTMKHRPSLLKTRLSPAKLLSPERKIVTADSELESPKRIRWMDEEGYNMDKRRKEEEEKEEKERIQREQEEKERIQRAEEEKERIQRAEEEKEEKERIQREQEEKEEKEEKERIQRKQEEKEEKERIQREGEERERRMRREKEEGEERERRMRREKEEEEERERTQREKEEGEERERRMRREKEEEERKEEERKRKEKEEEERREKERDEKKRKEKEEEERREKEREERRRKEKEEREKEKEGEGNLRRSSRLSDKKEDKEAPSFVNIKEESNFEIDKEDTERLERLKKVREEEERKEREERERLEREENERKEKEERERRERERREKEEREKRRERVREMEEALRREKELLGENVKERGGYEEQPPIIYRVEKKAEDVAPLPFKTCWNRPDYKNMSARQRESYYTEFEIKYKLLNKQLPPTMQIPPFKHGDDLNIVHDRYERYLCQVMGHDEASFSYMILLFVYQGIEALGTWLGLPIQGFTKFMLRKKQKMRSLLIQMGEKKFLSVSADWPVHIQLIWTVVSSLTCFVIYGFVGKKFGDKASDIAEQFGEYIMEMGSSNTVKMDEHGHPVMAKEDDPMFNEGLPGALSKLLEDGNFNLSGLFSMFGGGGAATNSTNTNTNSNTNTRTPTFNMNTNLYDINRLREERKKEEEEIYC